MKFTWNFYQLTRSSNVDSVLKSQFSNCASLWLIITFVFFRSDNGGRNIRRNIFGWQSRVAFRSSLFSFIFFIETEEARWRGITVRNSSRKLGNFFSLFLQIPENLVTFFTFLANTQKFGNFFSFFKQIPQNLVNFSLFLQI